MRSTENLSVVHVVESFAGGVLHFILDLTRRLPAKHLIVHGLRSDTPRNFKELFPENTQFIYWRSATREINPLRDLPALFELVKILRALRDKLDIIHLHSSKGGFLGRVASKILRLEEKVIYTPHSVSFLREDVQGYKRFLFKTLEKLAFSLGGQVVATSPSEREALEKVGIKAICIPNGIDIGEVREIAEREEPLIRRSGNEVLIGTAGRISPQKGPEIFAEISRELRDERTRFIWIGDGEQRKVLEKAKVEVTGWLPRERAIKAISQLDIYLSTSLWEGLPLAVLQAMALGKPLVLSDCVGNRDLVKDNGYLFKSPTEAVNYLRELVSNSELREKLGVKSLNLATYFSIEQMIERYKELYLSVANRIGDDKGGGDY